MKRACDQTNADPNSNERVSDKAEKKKKANQLAGQSIDESGKLKCQSSSKQEDQPEYLKQEIRTLEEELDNTKEDGMRNKKVVQHLQKFISDLRQEDEMSDVRYEAPTNIEKTYGDDILDEISSRIKDLKQRVLKGKPFKEKEKFEKQIKMSEERHGIKSNDWKTEKAALENKLKDSNESIILLNEKNENLNRDLKETQRVNVELQHQMQIEKDKYQNQYRELQHKETCIDNLERELQKTKNEKEELIVRLSKLDAACLTKDNPYIAHLSDTNRPNKIAERYSELYDNEWTDAFEEFRVKKHMEELQCIQSLVDLLKATYDACVQLTKPNREMLKTLTSVCITLHSDLTHTKHSAGIQDHSLGRSTSPDTALKMDENIKDNGRSIAKEVPKSVEEWGEKAQEFGERWQFLNCIGAIDGKHIVIQAPANRVLYYFNYKGTFSIVVLAVDYEFTYVDVAQNGRASDGGVYNASTLAKALETGELNITSKCHLPGTDKLVPYVFVGDDAFSLNKGIMKPDKKAALTNEERVFRLSRASRISENAFGILANLFRDFIKPLAIEP